MNIAEDGAVNTFSIAKIHASDKIIALAGNPNVGKSTVFNSLTGLNQHTGNWPGKTVATAQGVHRLNGNDYILVDLPGTYSIMAHSAEEEIARDFILFGGADAVIVVCDATCLERNLNLALQVMELTPNVVVCVNLLDEAEKRGISIDIPALRKKLGVPVVGTSARSGNGLKELMEEVESLCSGRLSLTPHKISYHPTIIDAISPLVDILEEKLDGSLNSTWLALQLLEKDEALLTRIQKYLGYNLLEDSAVNETITSLQSLLNEAGVTEDTLRDIIIFCIVNSAEEVAVAALSLCHGCSGCPGNSECSGCMRGTNNIRAVSNPRDRKLDRILTSKQTGIPIMLLLLCAVFWLTISGANIPSQLLSGALFRLQDRLTDAFLWLGTPEWVHSIFVLGMYRVLAWVISVMLPPMAIFFPIFTLLEDFGYLPRIAFNLDHQFKKAKTCGKQALTMAMGFGCNAAGVVGCRIIDSPRERIIAILTNNLVPCNGRFPTLIAIISMFFIGTAGGFWSSIQAALILTSVIILGVMMTFWLSRFLSETLLKGEASSFTLELPPYRTPQIGRVIVRSLFDRTLFVLGRAVIVAAPAGIIIWLFANITIGDITLLAHCSSFLDPFAKLLGLDGVILLAFILGFPANEIVVPIIIMTYMSTGSILELDSLAELKTLLTNNGWTWVTAVSTMLFCLFHWPCSTTCLTIRKETGSLKWTVLSFVLPTVIGISVCLVFNLAIRLLGLI